MTTHEYRHVPMNTYSHRIVERWTLFGKLISEQEYGCDEFGMMWVSLPDCAFAPDYKSIRFHQIQRAHEFAAREKAHA